MTQKKTEIEAANNSTPATTEQALPKMTIKTLFNRDDVKQKFQELLGKRASSFITSVLQVVQSNTELINADPTSIYQAAAVAATLDLPINNNLGFAYIVPYNSKQPDGSWKKVAQFQMGYKGFKQLALRSGQFLTMHATDVREGEIKHRDRLTGEIQFDWIQDESLRLEKPVIGFVSFFKLVNGYEQTFYMTIETLKSHGVKYSQTFKKGFGLWKDEFDSMAIKTVTKLNLSKNAPLSIEMQKAVTFDQAVIHNEETQEVSYVDNQRPVLSVSESPEIEEVPEEVLQKIRMAENPAELNNCYDEFPQYRGNSIFIQAIADHKLKLNAGNNNAGTTGDGKLPL